MKFIYKGTDGREELKKFLSETPKEKINQKSENPIVQSAGDFWTIQNVNYNGKISDYELSKNLLDSATQDEYIKNYLIAKQNNGFHCADMPLQYAIFKALHDSNSTEKEDARLFIQKSMREKYLMTLTRILYKPTKKTPDKVVHNYGLPNEEYIKAVDFVGPDRELILDDKNVLEALLLTNDTDEVKNVLKWINQTPVWIWRLNSKPNKLDGRVARFYADFVRANLSCNRNPSNRNSSLGIVHLFGTK